MLISRLSSQLLKASRIAGHLLPRSVSSFLCCRSTSAHYSTQPPNPSGAQPQQWHSLDPELEEILIPRKLSISPLESWLTVRYSLPKAEGAQEEVGHEPPPGSQCPPPAGGAAPGEWEGEGEGALGNTVQCKNVLKIRRRKMNRHKYKKLLKRRKFVRRRIKEGRKKKRQRSPLVSLIEEVREDVGLCSSCGCSHGTPPFNRIKFEKDLERIWKRAGLKGPPEGWQTPKIFLKSSRR